MSTMLPCVKACQAGDPAIHHLATPYKNEYDVRLLSYGQMALHGQVPNPFADMAIKAEYEGLDKLLPEKPDVSLYKEFDEFKSWAIATAIVPSLEVDYVHGFDAEGNEVQPQMPREDRDYLWLVVSRQEPIDGGRETFLEQLELVGKFRHIFESAPADAGVATAGAGPSRRAAP